MLLSQFTNLLGLLAALLHASFVIGSIGVEFQKVETDNFQAFSDLRTLRTAQVLRGDGVNVGTAKILKTGNLKLTGNRNAASFRVIVTWHFSDQSASQSDEHLVRSLNHPTEVVAPESPVEGIDFLVTFLKPGKQMPSRFGRGQTSGSAQMVSDEEFQAAFFGSN